MAKRQQRKTLTVPNMAAPRRVRPRRVRHFLGQGLLAAFLGVATAAPGLAASLQLPALVEPASDEHHVGKVVFVELVTPDIAAAKQFYAGLFGWTYRDVQAAGYNMRKHISTVSRSPGWSKKPYRPASIGSRLG